MVFWISASLIYSPVVMAQAAALAGYELFMAKVTTFGATTVAYATNGAVLANGVRTFSAPTFSAGGAAVATAARVAVGTGSAAVVVTGGVTGAEVFAAARLLAMGGSGVVGIGLTALTMAPMVVDYFTTPDVQLGPLSARESDKPFLKRIDSNLCFDTVCYEYSHPFGNGSRNWGSPSAACSAGIAEAMALNPSLEVTLLHLNPQSLPKNSPYTGCQVRVKDKTWGNTSEGDNPLVYRIVPPSTSSSTIPASWDDIAPYMDKPISPEVFKSLLDAGAKIKVTPRSITGPAEVLEPATTSTTETPEKLTTTTTTGKTKLEYKERIDPATGKTEPYVQATPSSTVVTKEKDNATGIEKVVSTTETKTDEKPKATETPDLCALHPEIVACATVEQVDMCKLYPESLACQKTDEPEVPDLETKEKPITFTPDSGWGPSTGSCPAPRHLVSGTGADFSFTPYCDFMTALRPVLLAVAWLSGAMILIGANRKE